MPDEGSCFVSFLKAEFWDRRAVSTQWGDTFSVLLWGLFFGPETGPKVLVLEVVVVLVVVVVMVVRMSRWMGGWGEEGGMLGRVAGRGGEGQNFTLDYRMKFGQH